MCLRLCLTPAAEEWGSPPFSALGEPARLPPGNVARVRTVIRQECEHKLGAGGHKMPVAVLGENR